MLKRQKRKWAIGKDDQRKKTSSRVKRHSKNKKTDLGREFTATALDSKQLEKKRVRGGNVKKRLKSGNRVNVVDPDSDQAQVLEIEDVTDNPADPHLARREIMTKGAVVETDAGKVRITSRPGQDGVLNGVFVSD